jgi:F0F1-type ATP synthase membrane subunit b/b'
MTETLWKEQAKGKQVESELNDARLVIKNMAADNAEIRAQMDRERNMNQVNIERTRSEIERMRERQDKELNMQNERTIEALQKECSHFRNLCEEIER